MSLTSLIMSIRFYMVLHNVIFADGGSFNVHFITWMYRYIDFIQNIYSNYAVSTYINCYLARMCVLLQICVHMCIYDHIEYFFAYYFYINYPFLYMFYYTFVQLS